jgi:hypothetical protein
MRKYLLTSFAMAMLFCIGADVCRPRLAQTYLDHLLAQTARVLQTAAGSSLFWTITVHLRVEISHNGTVRNFREVLARVFSSHALPSILAAWADMFGAGVLSACLEGDANSIADILRFIVTFGKWRRSSGKRPLSQSTMKKLFHLRETVCYVIAAGVDIYTLQHYTLWHSVDKAMPTRGRQAGKKRKYVRLDPGSIFDLMADSREVSTSLRELVKIRRKDAHVGSSQSATDVWHNKAHNMYSNKRRSVFQEVQHWNIVLDGSVHSKRDCIVSLCYSWEAEQACYGDCQFVHQGPHLLPSEQEMPDAICELVARRKHERWSSFRQLQAASNILAQASSHRISSIADFKLPTGVDLDPIRLDERRCVRATADGRKEVLYITQRPGEPAPSSYRMEIAPDARLAEIKLLILGLDQGSCGAAGVGYGQEMHKSTMVARWDKLHRLMRDMRLSLSHACQGIFLKTQLYSSHIFSINWKPMGTGLYGTLKRRLLDVFLQQTTMDRPWCQRYKVTIWSNLGHIV